MPEALACPNCSAPLELSSAAGDPPVVSCRYCGSQVMVRELQVDAMHATGRDDAAPAGPASEAEKFTDGAMPGDARPPQMEPHAGLEQVAQLARSGERQAAIKLYRESQDSSRQEALLVVQLLQDDYEIQPGWAVERVRRQLESRRAPEVGKEHPNRGNWVVYGMLVLLVLALLVPLLVALLSG